MIRSSYFLKSASIKAVPIEVPDGEKA